jgi:hypothetical protein
LDEYQELTLVVTSTANKIHLLNPEINDFTICGTYYQQKNMVVKPGLINETNCIRCLQRIDHMKARGSVAFVQITFCTILYGFLTCIHLIRTPSLSGVAFSYAKNGRVNKRSARNGALWKLLNTILC